MSGNLIWIVENNDDDGDDDESIPAVKVRLGWLVEDWGSMHNCMLLPTRAGIRTGGVCAVCLFVDLCRVRTWVQDGVDLGELCRGRQYKWPNCWSDDRQKEKAARSRRFGKRNGAIVPIYVTMRAATFGGREVHVWLVGEYGVLYISSMFLPLLGTSSTECHFYLHWTLPSKIR